MAEAFYVNPGERSAHLAEVRGSKRVREAVFMLVLQRQGTTMDPGVEPGIWADVDAIAQEFYVSNEEMRGVMHSLEPTLEFGSEV